MKNNQLNFIFDLDGTLYKFDKGRSDVFYSSDMYFDLKKNIYFFLIESGIANPAKVQKVFENIDNKYNGEISIGIEKEFGIDRYFYYKNTWGKLTPKKYIKKNKNLLVLLSPFTNRSILLTSAPLIWAFKVLKFLEIEEIFKDRVYTGEPDLRKPNPKIFEKIAKDFLLPTNQFLSIGDQENTDIIPAKAIGMKTLKIGVGNTIADFQAKNISLALEILKKEKIL